MELNPGEERERQYQRARALTRIAIETSDRLTSTRINGRLFVLRDGASRDALRALALRGSYWGKRDPLAAPSELEPALREAVADSPIDALKSERLIELAALASGEVAVSARNELYPRGMQAERALKLCAAAILPSKHTAADVRQLILARYPECATLPDGEALAALLESTGIKLSPVSSAPADASSTEDHRLPSLRATHVLTTDLAEQAKNEFLVRLRAAKDKGLFRVLAVPAVAMVQAAEKLGKELACSPVSIDALLIAAIESERTRLEIDEAVIHAADRAGPQSEDWPNLRTLAKAAAKNVLKELQERSGTLLLTDPGLLARYELSEFLARLRALSERDNAAAIFLVVPSHAELHAPPIDSLYNPLPVPVVAQNEWIPLPPAWMRVES